MSMKRADIGLQNRDFPNFPSPSPSGPDGAEQVDKESEGKPSVADSASKQSPASLQGNVVSDALACKPSVADGVPTQSPSGLKGQVIASFGGAEGKQS